MRRCSKGARHDFSPKVFLGHQLRSSGKAEGEEALDILAKSPATARHISFKLAQYFVADEPPPPLVERLGRPVSGDRRRYPGGAQGAVHQQRVLESYGHKYKTPYHFVVSAARAAGVPVNNTRPLLAAISQLGMPLFGCLTPDGYKNTEAAWLSPDATTRRISFATAFARGGLPVGSLPRTRHAVLSDSTATPPDEPGRRRAPPNKSSARP